MMFLVSPKMSARVRRLAFSSVAAACLVTSGAGLGSVAQAGPLMMAPPSQVALPKLTEDVRYRRPVAWRHYGGYYRHGYYRRSYNAFPAALAFGLMGAALTAAVASNSCNYYDPWGGCVGYRGVYPAYAGYPVYAGGYYPAYRRSVIYPRYYNRARFVGYRGGPRFVAYRAGPRFAYRAGPRFVNRAGFGPRVMRGRR